MLGPQNNVQHPVDPFFLLAAMLLWLNLTLVVDAQQAGLLKIAFIIGTASSH
jgi:hypothetical protein